MMAIPLLANLMGPHTDQSSAVSIHLYVLSYSLSKRMLVAGDIIGCGVDFTEGTAFYTKNGEFLSTLPQRFHPFHRPRAQFHFRKGF
jgi:hypothetical protein